MGHHKLGALQRRSALPPQPRQHPAQQLAGAAGAPVAASPAAARQPAVQLLQLRPAARKGLREPPWTPPAGRRLTGWVPGIPTVKMQQAWLSASAIRKAWSGGCNCSVSQRTHDSTPEVCKTGLANRVHEGAAGEQNLLLPIQELGSRPVLEMYSG